jgi:ring-1,2-phenylacetyl-CoA epoxidase subunit PaaC
MSFDDDAYGALTDHDDDARWAYGTGFADPLAGVPTTVPGDVDRADLTAYCLMLGDDALVMSHRLQQWVTRAPELEDELALANIGLDLLGQARLLLGRAGEVEGAGRDEDALAYLRDAGEFRNVRPAERGQHDFGEIDWAEFKRVIAGGGPLNAQRIAHRRRADEEGAWVREAAAAHATKQASRRERATA